jgi:hypothetical protein
MASFTILLDKVTMPKGLSLIAGYQGYLLSILYGVYRIHNYQIHSDSDLQHSKIQPECMYVEYCVCMEVIVKKM